MTTAGATPASGPARILVRGVNWLGDAVMTTPALQRLRERFAGAHITLLTHQKLADLWVKHPSVNSVVTFEPGETVWSIGRRLRGERFDVGLVLPNSPRAALEVWLARIPIRIGLARPWRNWFLTKRVGERPGHVQMRKRSVVEIKSLTAGKAPDVARVARPQGVASSHQIHEYLYLAAALGAEAAPVAPLVSITSDEVQASAAKFGLKVSSGGKVPVLALNPGAEYGPAKRWPVERFIEVAREIRNRTGCTWLIIGGAGDLPIASQIHAALLAERKEKRGGEPALLLAGQTSLRELMALLKLSRVLLTNDSGPMHLGAALGTPVVVPFGSTSPELTGPGVPGDDRHRLLTARAPCSPCFLRVCPIDFRCMTGIPVASVVNAVMASIS